MIVLFPIQSIAISPERSYDEGKPGAAWSVETIKKTKSGDIQVASRGVPEKKAATYSPALQAVPSA